MNCKLQFIRQAIHTSKFAIAATTTKVVVKTGAAAEAAEAAAPVAASEFKTYLMNCKYKKPL